MPETEILESTWRTVRLLHDPGSPSALLCLHPDSNKKMPLLVPCFLGHHSGSQSISGSQENAWLYRHLKSRALTLVPPYHCPTLLKRLCLLILGPPASQIRSEGIMHRKENSWLCLSWYVGLAGTPETQNTMNQHPTVRSCEACQVPFPSVTGVWVQWAKDHPLVVIIPCPMG